MNDLKDLLGRLTYEEACALLGKEGELLLQKGGRWDIRIENQVELSKDQFLLDLGDIRVGISAPKNGPDQPPVLYCSRCLNPCVHMGAALALILEEKSALGLAGPSNEPPVSLAEQDMTRRALADRRARAQSEPMTMLAAEPDCVWTDYSVTNQASGRTYRVALRGLEPGVSYCSCPDYRKNTLGTCKHILFVLQQLQKSTPDLETLPPYRRDHFCVTIRYGKTKELYLLPPQKVTSARLHNEVMPLTDHPINQVTDLLHALRVIEDEGVEVVVYPDAEDFIDRLFFLDRIRARVAEIRADPDHHPLRWELLKSELLPYQLDGIAFATAAGRAILADEMGLGKTVQGIGVAALLDREVGLQRTLVICPTSLKRQWQEEIRRFSNYACHVVEGPPEERLPQYGTAFFTLCNYEQVLRDIQSIEQVAWDLIILDEGQRIKNWEAKTARIVKGLRSPYALVLTGTPLETRLDELYSIVEFIDDRILGPAFAFFETHQVLDENDRVVGYKNLDRLREQLQPVMLRRTRENVLTQLPERKTETIFVEPTSEQLDIHDRHRQTIASVLGRRTFTEMDLIRLRKALLMCRRAANASFLAEKTAPNHSSKLQALQELLERLARHDASHKIILFSEWTGMLDLVEPLLLPLGLGYVRIDGGVSAPQREERIQRLRDDPDCRLLISTNPGSLGLNLQCADTVINLDVPWTPALLEQRISRVHRMGQDRPVQVFLLVTANTIEENLLKAHAHKQELADAALDPDSEIDEIRVGSRSDMIRARIGALLSPEHAETPVGPPRNRTEPSSRKVLEAETGNLLMAAVRFLEPLLGQSPKPNRASGEAIPVRALLHQLKESAALHPDGSVNLSVRLPNEQALEELAEILLAYHQRQDRSKIIE